MAIIEAILNRDGTGKLAIAGNDISGESHGIEIKNSVHCGNKVEISLIPSNLKIIVDSEEIYFLHQGKRYRLLEIEEE